MPKRKEKKNPNAKDLSSDTMQGMSVIGKWDFEKGGFVPLDEDDIERIYGDKKPEDDQ